jgi:phospholipid N-methyltransferase
MKENQSLIEVDLRLTECGQESEFIINQILKQNQDLDRVRRIEEKNQIYKSLNRTYSHIF